MLDAVRFRLDEGSSKGVKTSYLSIPSNANADFGTLYTVDLNLGDSNLNHNFNLLFSKNWRPLIVKNETLKKISSLGDWITYLFHKSEEDKKVRKIAKTTVIAINKTIPKLQDSNIFVYQTAFHAFFNKMIDKKILKQKVIKEGSKLDKFLTIDLQLQKEDLIEKMIKVGELPGHVNAIREMVKSAILSAYEEALFFESLGIKMQIPNDGSGGTRNAKSRHQKVNDNAQAILKVKRRDAGADGKNNTSYQSMLKKIFRTAPSSLYGTSGPQAERLAYCLDSHFGLFMVPPTHCLDVESQTYMGATKAQGSIQAFIENSKKLSDVIHENGIETRYEGLPRSYLRNHYKQYEAKFSSFINTKYFQRLGWFSWLIGSVDTHAENILLKRNEYDPNTLTARLLRGDKVSEKEIRRFVKKLFKPRKKSKTSDERISNYQILLNDIMHLQVKPNEQEPEFLLISIDNEKSFPHSYPSSFGFYSYLETRFNRLVFDIFPVNEETLEEEEIENISSLKESYINFLEEMSLYLFEEAVPYDTLKDFLSKNANVKLLNEWLNTPSQKTTSHNKNNSRERQLRKKIVDEWCPIGTPNCVRKAYNNDLKRIHGILTLSREKWSLLKKHLSLNISMRELYKTRTISEFDEKLNQLEKRHDEGLNIHWNMRHAISEK